MNESILIENKEQVLIKGANRVVSSTQTQAVVETKDSIIVITGHDMEVKKLDLDNGEVSFNGKISNVKISNGTNTKTPFLKRIFK